MYWKADELMLESFVTIIVYLIGVLFPLLIPIAVTIRPKIAPGIRGTFRIMANGGEKLRSAITRQAAGAPRPVRWRTPADNFGATASPKL